MAPSKPKPPVEGVDQKRALGERLRDLLFVTPKSQSVFSKDNETMAWYNRPILTFPRGQTFSYTDNKWLVGGDADAVGDIQPVLMLDSLVPTGTDEVALGAKLDGEMSPKPTVRAICETGPNGDLVGIAIQGASHVRGKIPCQDRFASWGEGDNGCIVVCDGAGFEGYRRTGEGAQILCATVAEFIRVRQTVFAGIGQADLKLQIMDAIARAQKIMMAQPYYAKDDLSLEDFSCTLVGIFWCENGHMTFHIGDGLIIVGQSQPDSVMGTKLHLSHPRNGEHSNETFFFPTYQRDLRIAFGPCISFACVMSDGVQDLTYNAKTGAVHTGFLNPILHRYSEKGPDWLKDRLFGTLYNDGANAISADDKTFVVYFKKPFLIAAPTCVDEPTSPKAPLPQIKDQTQ